MDPPHIITLVSKVQNRENEFKFKFKFPLDYSGDHFAVGLKEIFCPPLKDLKGPVSVHIDCIKPHLVYPSYSQILSYIEPKESAKISRERYETPIFHPLNCNVINEINIKFLNPEGGPASFARSQTDQITLILQFKRIPYGRYL